MSLLLLLIHQSVYPMHNCIYIRSMRRFAQQETNTDMIKRTRSVCVPSPAFFQTFYDGPGDITIINSNEFISAKSIKFSLTADDSGTGVSKVLKIQITGHVAVLVIDLFKVVQVHKQDRKRTSGFQTGIQIIPQLHPVPKTGQRLMTDPVLKLAQPDRIQYKHIKNIM